ncbi:MAG: hypothetical protein ACOYOV_00445 [Bacteroidales bacterium]
MRFKFNPLTSTFDVVAGCAAATASETSLQVEEVSASLIYLGEGTFGALTSEAKWKIKKIVISGSTVSIKNASDAFDQIWNNRASLTYV